MAIVEDEVRNDSEEENEIEVVVEEDDPEEQESGDEESEDEGSDDEEDLENKVAELEKRVALNPYNYDEHIELIQALWSLSELDRWRAAFEQLHQVSSLAPEHWLLRLQTEVSLAHTPADKDRVADLFRQATLDCYSIPILTEWCTWAVGVGEPDEIRAQLDEVLRRAGDDPLSGKLFWDTKKEFELNQLEAMSEEDPQYKAQLKRVISCLEEIVSRPLLHNENAWPEFQQYASKLEEQEYIDKVKKRHEATVDFLQKITKYEDKLLISEKPNEKCFAYTEYITTIKDLAKDLDKNGPQDLHGITKVLYDRATYDCMKSKGGRELAESYVSHVRDWSSRTTYERVLDMCIRRYPNAGLFWTLKMQHYEAQNKEFDDIKNVLETGLSRGMQNYKDGESLWMSYLEYLRRKTDFSDEASVDKLRRTFRIAWESLAAVWGPEANDCEVPLFWARLEYRIIRDHKQGKEIFEELFKYGENKSMSKYWEALIKLETYRDPPPSEHKLRELHRRAVRFVTDYPPSVCRLWREIERETGTLDSMLDCNEVCEVKIKEWRDGFLSQKEYQGQSSRKFKSDKPNRADRREDKKSSKGGPSTVKGKRKLEDEQKSTETKKKKDDKEESEVKDKGKSLKRPHGENEQNEGDVKRQRDNSLSETISNKDNCTLFVSNLPFKVSYNNLHNKLSEYGEIVSLRIKTGVKAFGGSICYCHYKTLDAVEEALKHDRTHLDGRPMFLSRFSAQRTKPSFKYSTGAERNKLFVKNLPFSSCTKEALTEVFEPHGKLQDIRVVSHKDGKPKGLAYVEYEDDESAATALKKTNGLLIGDRKIEVAFSAPPSRSDAPQSTLGQMKRDSRGGMRRTQLSDLVPSVLQRPSTSKANPVNSEASNGHSEEDKKKLSNSDFRKMLLSNSKSDSAH